MAMNKNRLTSFIDAVLAIAMTLMVFNLKAPHHFDFVGFWYLRTQFFAYALSFFWFGTMWVNLHIEWDKVSSVRRKTVWLSLIMLFFSSLFPYPTLLVSDQFDNRSVQFFYGCIVLGVTLSNTALYRSIGLRKTSFFIRFDIVAKVLALGISILFFQLPL